MTTFDYEVLTAEKPDGVSLEQAQSAIAEQYPDHHVVVEDKGNTFVATIARKSRVSRTVVAADDDALDLLDDAPPAPKKDEDGPADDDDKPKEPKDEKPEGEDKPKDDDGDDKGGDDLSKAIEALKTLEKALPKLKDLLGGGDLGLGDDEVHTPLPDEGLGPMDGPPHKAPGPVGPVPGAPPAAAMGDEPPVMSGGPPRPPRRPPVPSGRAPRPVGVPTFSKRQNKVVFRPVANEDGTEVSLTDATREIAEHPKYAGYDVVNVKKDDQHYVAHLKLREE